MTDKTDPALSGEEREKRRRRGFWRYLAIVIACSLLAGILSGYLAGAYLEGDIGLWVPVLAVVLIVAGVAWFSIDYYKRVDELDVMDNLWAHLIGSNVGVIITGVWWFFADIELVRVPTAADAILIILAAILITYSLRKLNFR